MKESPRKKVLNELSANVDNMQQLPIGSEEYLNAAKASNQQAEAAQKLKTWDAMGLVNLAVSTIALGLTFVASEKSLLDTRPVSFIKGLFKR